MFFPFFFLRKVLRKTKCSEIEKLQIYITMMSPFCSTHKVCEFWSFMFNWYELCSYGSLLSKGTAESMKGNHQVGSARQLRFVSWMQPRAFTLPFPAKHSSLTFFTVWFSIYLTVLILFYISGRCVLTVCVWLHVYLVRLMRSAGQ